MGGSGSRSGRTRDFSSQVSPTHPTWCTQRTPNVHPQRTRTQRTHPTDTQRTTNVHPTGNRFIVDKLELSTGRVLAVVDETVWRLHGDTLRDWAASLDLKLDAVVAPGNEDHKTMENW